MTKEQLLDLARTYAEHRGITLSTVATYAANAGGFFRRLEDPDTSCTLRTVERVTLWFDENWPEDLEWPSGIDRPRGEEEGS